MASILTVRFFNIAPEDHKAYLVYNNKLPYRLMPCINSLTGKVFLHNYTIMRELVMDFSDDKNVQDIREQFMFGPGLLINLVAEYKATKRKMYLSAGTGCYNLYGGKYFYSGQSISADAPYRPILVFVKEGDVLPYGP